MSEGVNSGRHLSTNEQISQILDIDQTIDKKAERPCHAYSTLIGGTLYMIVSATLPSY